MKRTKEGFTRDHPEWMQTEGCSGVKELEGEDLSYDARMKFQKEQQKQWIEQQIAEKKWKKEQERLEEEAYARQTLELNRMRGMLEDDYKRKKQELQLAQTNQNLDLALQQKELEKKKKQEQLEYEKSEVELTKERGVKRPFNG